MTSPIPLATDVHPRSGDLADLTDEVQDVLVAEKRLECIRTGRTQAVPIAEVMKRYGW